MSFSMDVIFIVCKHFPVLDTHVLHVYQCVSCTCVSVCICVSSLSDVVIYFLPMYFAGDNVNEEVQHLVSGYTAEMELLRTKLLESEAMRNSAPKSSRTPPSRLSSSTPSRYSVYAKAGLFSYLLWKFSYIMHIYI